MEWILCDERLPKEGQMVLTTIRGHDVIIVQDEETFEEAIERVWNEVCYVSVGFIGSDGWYGADGYPLIVHPIAWMPLPKPYRKTENSSEKPNNCEVENYCDDCLYTDTCDDKAFFYACTSKATISKMEQVEDEPQTVETMSCQECKHFNENAVMYLDQCEFCFKECHYEPKDESQTEEHCNTCRHKDECEGATYEYKNTEWWCLAYAPIDEPQTDVYDYKGNGKWERSK